MYAILETGGKQYRVKVGDVITVEKLDAKEGDTVTFEKVLVVGDEDSTQVGTPFLSTPVTGTVVENGKGKKVIIYKYKAKKDYRRKQGHRQPYTMVEITGIGGKGGVKPAPKKEEVKKEEVPAKSEKTKKVSMSMKKDELIAFAKENDIKIDTKATKQVIIDTINETL